MIFSIILRNYKTYQGINYIPLSNSKWFSAIVGENGAGKSSILEALNSFFNNTEWNVHHSMSKGFQEREPFICPVFLIEKKKFPELDQQWLIDSLSEMTWSTKATDFNPSVKTHAELFCNHRTTIIQEGITQESHYLIPFGVIKTSSSSSTSVYFSIFETLNRFSALTKYAKYKEAINELQSEIIKHYKYIYIPSEIDYIEYTKIEGATIQALLGQRLEQIVRTFIRRDAITEINRKLELFLNQISETLIDYEYKKPSRKQNLVNQSHFTEKVIEAYFESKVLCKKISKETIPVKSLSSGEKRKALIDISKAFLTSENHSSSHQIILAIDEPELSLHLSSAFQQFESLKHISSFNNQVIITTHWYGFTPIISDGTAVYCSSDSEHPRLLDLRCFREEIKKLKADTNGQLPVELELKGVNDLVHSIVASVTRSDYRWIICEGSADKIYLDHYLQNTNVRVVAVGGSPALKKIYKYLDLALEDARGSISGRIFFLLDTDKAYEKFDSRDSIKELQIKRLKNSTETHQTELLSTTNNDFYPPTVIEDTLPAKPFIETIKHFKDNGEYSSMISQIDFDTATIDDTTPSAIALNLRQNDRVTLDSLFNEKGFKVQFALKYISIANRQPIPSWINEILNFLYPPEATISNRPPRRKRQKP